MSKKTEELLEEMTKVEPSKLSENAYTFYKTICEILDENDKLRKYENKYWEILGFIKENKKDIEPTLCNKLILILK